MINYFVSHFRCADFLEISDVFIKDGVERLELQGKHKNEKYSFEINFVYIIHFSCFDWHSTKL